VCEYYFPTAGQPFPVIRFHRSGSGSEVARGKQKIGKKTRRRRRDKFLELKWQFLTNERSGQKRKKKKTKIQFPSAEIRPANHGATGSGIMICRFFGPPKEMWQRGRPTGHTANIASATGRVAAAG